MSYNETIPIQFTPLAAPFNLKFVRDGPMVSITIPPIGFSLIGPTPNLKSAPIPDQYIPSNKSVGWMIITGASPQLCNVSVNTDGTITIYYGPNGASFPVASGYNTNNFQTVRYLI